MFWRTSSYFLPFCLSWQNSPEGRDGGEAFAPGLGITILGALRSVVSCVCLSLEFVVFELALRLVALMFNDLLIELRGP